MSPDILSLPDDIPVTVPSVLTKDQRSVNTKLKIPSHSWSIAFRYQADTGSLNDTEILLSDSANTDPDDNL